MAATRNGAGIGRAGHPLHRTATPCSKTKDVSSGVTSVSSATDASAAGTKRGASFCHQTSAHATAGDPPYGLYHPAAHPDEPVVHVDGRVAVARDQLDLLAESQRRGGRACASPSQEHRRVTAQSQACHAQACHGTATGMSRPASAAQRARETPPMRRVRAGQYCCTRQTVPTSPHGPVPWKTKCTKFK